MVSLICKMNKRGISPILIGIIVVSVIMGLIFGGIFLVKAITPTISCDDAPYNEDCFCPEGTRKVSVPLLGIPRWNCENLEQLILDPESLTFEEDAKNFVVAYLRRYCGTVCTDMTCGTNKLCTNYNSPDSVDACIDVASGHTSSGERIVNVECRVILERDELGRPKSGTIPWRMNFFIEGPTELPKVYPFFSNYCVDPDKTERCEPPTETVNLLSIINPLNYFDKIGSGFSPTV